MNRIAARLNLPTQFNFPTLLLSLCFVGVGLLLTYLLGRVTTLECTRQEGLAPCNLHTTWMGLMDLSDRPLRHLYAAYVEEDCSDDCVYRVALETEQGRLPLDGAYISDYADRSTKVDAINAFIADPEQSSLSVQDGGGFWLLLPLIFVALGVGMGLAPILGQWLATFNRG